MNLPAGVAVEQWAAALRVIGHPWQSRCDNCRPRDPDHPTPAVTDELLMRMLREGLKRKSSFLMQVDYRLDGVDPLLNQTTLDAAIVLATASLEEQ